MAHMARTKVCKTAAEFAVDLERAAQLFTTQSVRDTTVAVALELVRNVSLRTPADTGRARASWNIAEGAIDRSVQPEAAGDQKIPEKEYDGKGLTGQSVIYVSNSLPYIESLEYGLYPEDVKRGTWNKRTKKWEKRSEGGFSKQAPTGMLRIAIRELQRKVGRK